MEDTKTLACDLIAQHAGCDRSVQGLDVPLHRQRNNEVRFLPDQLGNAHPFIANNQGAGAGIVQLTPRLPIEISGINPDPALFEFFYNSGKVGYARHRDIFHRTRRRLAHREGQADGAPLRDDDPMRARTLRRTQDSPQIVGVLQAVGNIFKDAFVLDLGRKG